jgi:acyl-ACP thioesterase
VDGGGDTFGFVSAVAAASELIAPPDDGRVFTSRRQVRLGDVDQRGRLRLDAIARYLQDIATDDTADAGLDADGQPSSWVVRRTMIDITRSARLDEALELRTFCSGTGRGWAERRTTLDGRAGATIEAVSLWIRIDAASGRPIGLGDRFAEIYGPTAADRRVSARLQLPAAPADARRRPWPIRAVDLDPLRHVNNAVHWSIVEEVLPEGSRRGRGEIEYLVPIEPDIEAMLCVDGQSSWLLGGDRVLTAARWTPAS